MNDEEPLSPKELFKYKSNNKNNNSMVCPSALIGKVSLKPDRTKFNIGIYLTSYKGVNSRYFEDILSIGYTPFERCSIDLKVLCSNYTLINNEDQKLDCLPTAD